MKYLFISIGLVIVIISGMYLLTNFSKTNSSKAKAQEATIYKSPNCGCCVHHKDYLEKNGYQVSVKLTDNMDDIKKKYQIPEDMQSCHTTIIGDYFFEGHLPIAAINKIMKENPKIDGISLPGMPAGSPGMPGQKREPFTIYQLTGQQTAEYSRI